jgi:hypothetical protein
MAGKRSRRFDASRTSEHWRQAFREIDSVDDRSAAIMGASIVEDCLTSYLTAETVAGKIAVNLFQNVLDTFGKKINCAYVFALIDRSDWRELDFIRKIRNEFAHDIFGKASSGAVEFSRLTFESEPIRTWCASLEYPNWLTSVVSDPRERFEWSVMLSSLGLQHAHEIKPLNRKAPAGFVEEVSRFFVRVD